MIDAQGVFLPPPALQNWLCPATGRWRGLFLLAPNTRCPHTPAAMTAVHAQRALRDSLARFATGVTVVTCSAADGSPCGITANSFSSVSLDPPLVLWNIAKVSNSLQAYLDARHFAIHILREDQQHLSEHFARSDHTVYTGIDYSMSSDGVPILPDVLARFDCVTNAIHDAGDHFIIVGEVIEHSHDSGDPLLFFNSDYRSIG